MLLPTAMRMPADTIALGEKVEQPKRPTAAEKRAAEVLAFEKGDHVPGVPLTAKSVIDLILEVAALLDKQPVSRQRRMISRPTFEAALRERWIVRSMWDPSAEMPGEGGPIKCPCDACQGRAFGDIAGAMKIGVDPARPGSDAGDSGTVRVTFDPPNFGA